MKKIFALSCAWLWITISEFVRNQLLFHHFWIDHYQRLGMVFPSSAINAFLWVVWSLCFAIIIFALQYRYSLLHTTLISWSAGFGLMWLAIANLGVLPLPLLLYALPLSAIECCVAGLIIKKILQ